MLNKLAIIGSRTFTDFDFLKNVLVEHFSFYDSGATHFKFTEIISGGAQGADALAKQFALKYNIKYTEFPADWYNLEVVPCDIKLDKLNRPYNRLAGFNRNKLIVDSADFILAMTTGSPGTKNSLDYAAKKKKPCLVYYV